MNDIQRIDINEPEDVNAYYNDQCPITNTDAFSSRDVEYGQVKVKLYDYQGPIENTWFVICTMCRVGFEWGIYYVLTYNDGILTNYDGNATLTLATTDYGVNELSRTFYYPNLSYPGCTDLSYPDCYCVYKTYDSYLGELFVKTGETTYSCFNMRGPKYGCSFICGDADKNDEVNMDDVYSVAEYDVDLLGPDDIDLYASDIDRDGDVDIYDALGINLYIEGMWSTLECNFNCSCW
ncbi:MAG: hypothetical protein GY795_12260 [Desulfobacterales bacterium]|nr:hypothetical protein [Desulfobacterales bacterium]